MSNIKGLVLMLIIVVAAIFGLYCYADLGKSETTKSATYGYVEVAGEKEVSQNRVIVSDKFVGDFDQNGKVVAISSDGQAYIVQGGAVLVSDIVVTADDESYSVYRIDTPEFSVESE